MSYQHNPYLEETDSFYYYKWKFIGTMNAAHDLAFLRFRNEDTQQELRVHTHPINHDADASSAFPTAVDCPQRGRLADSVRNSNPALYVAATKYLRRNPIRRPAPVPQGVDNRPEFSQEEANSQYRASRDLGSGTYRPGAMSAAKSKFK